MLDKVLLGLTCLVATIVGLVTLPYWLCRVWVNRIPFKKQGKRPDFDLVKPKPVG